MKTILLMLAPLALAACTTTHAPSSGGLTAYDGLAQREGMQRAGVLQKRDDSGLGKVRSVFIEPVNIAATPATDWLSDEERTALRREMDAQLCFELTERYVLAPAPDAADARVRAVISSVSPTGKASSVVSAASSFFIPGPLGLRPGGLGALSAEAEMLDGSGRQLAAITWNREAQAIGTDNPSLSRIGDALQFLEPFADTAAAVMTADGAKDGSAPSPDPCSAYGPRIRPGGWLAKMATGLYVPQAGAAKPEGEPVRITPPPPQ